MYKLKGICRIILISMLTICAFSSTVCAGTDKGSIQITLSDGKEGTEKEGVVFAYKKVADVVNGEYKGIKEYSSGVDFNKIQNARELEEAALKIKNQVKNPDGRVVTDKNGKTYIRNLDIGVYLIYAENEAKYERVNPFLVAIPTWNAENNKMKFDIEVIPKHEPIPEDTPEAPQTNLDNHYKEMLVIAGGSIMLAISLLYFNHRDRKVGQ